MAFDFNSCKLVGPVNGRFGAAGLMVPPRVEDCPEREVLKGQFFATRSKVEQENIRKLGGYRDGTVFAKWFRVMGKVDSMRDKKTGLVDDLNDLKAFAEAMRPGELTVISGSSGVGKTTLALRIAQALVGPDDAAETEASKRALVFTPRHRSEFFVQKGLCRRRIYIDDFDRLDVTGIDCRTRAMRRMFGVNLLIVDSVQSLRENSGSAVPASVAEAAQQLRDLGAELGIPVLFVSECPDAPFCVGVCELAAVGDLANAADVAICLRRNADTGKGSYCMSRKVERPTTI